MALDSERLRTFLAVARARNFSRAARQLGKTQPSVSQAVAALEKALGQTLFVRDGRTTHLTAAGKLLQQHAEAIFAEMDRAQAALAGLHELRRGELVVGTSDTLAYYLLPPVFAAFRARYPGVELRLDNRPSPATAAQVAARAVDVGVVTSPLAPDSRLRFEPLLPHDDVAICAPGHPLARKRQVRLDELLAQPLLLLDRTTGARAALDAVFARSRIQPRVTMEMSSVEVLKRLVELGFGLSVVPALAVERELRARTLSAVRVPLPTGRQIGLVTPAAGPMAPAAIAFVEIARSLLVQRAGRRRARAPEVRE